MSGGIVLLLPGCHVCRRPRLWEYYSKMIIVLLYYYYYSDYAGIICQYGIDSDSYALYPVLCHRQIILTIVAICPRFATFPTVHRPILLINLSLHMDFIISVIYY